MTDPVAKMEFASCTPSISVIELWKNFINPPVICRSKPFWAWNHLCEEKELRRQINIFKRMGFGGFFIHSRTGLKTKYLSNEWFDAVKASVDEAEKIGLEAWLYDEDRWPSGTAGGLVTKSHQYRMKCLKYDKICVEDISWSKSGLDTYVFAAYFILDKLHKYVPIATENDLKSIEKPDCLLVFTVGIISESTQYNGQTYIDTLNPKAVKEFIDITHEAYYREVGGYFGTAIPGIFTDEPNCNDGWNKKDELTWSDILPEYFQCSFGYDITKRLPEIFLNMTTSLYSKVRYDYYVCRSRMFTQAYGAQIGQWCEEHKLALTGHGICEYPLSEQAGWTGSLMSFYAQMQIPGIDMLTDYTNEYITPKQCSSVARQTGRKWVLSELYGCTGWETTFADYKYMGDWQAVLGITMRCPHLSWYSMAGEAKRDYPASIHFHSPWWRQYMYIEDYFARINSVLAEGCAVCDTAIINPIESFYLFPNISAAAGVKDKIIAQYDELYDQINKWLIGTHIDFDYIDEELTAATGYEIIQKEQTTLKIGCVEYKLILVPPVLTLRYSTLQMLEQFANKGGKVIFIGDAPMYIDGEFAQDAARFAQDKRICLDKDIIQKQLKHYVGKVDIKDENDNEISDIFCQLRRIDDSYCLFIVNINRDTAHRNISVTVSEELIGRLGVQIWDAVNGKKYYLPSVSASDSEIKFSVDLSKGESLFLVISYDTEILSQYVKVMDGQREPIEIKKWDYELDDHNAVVLDRADCMLMHDGQQILRLENQEILTIDDLLRKELGYPLRTGTAIQDWAKDKADTQTNVTVQLSYEFFISIIPTAGIKLAIEQPANWRICLNDGIIQVPLELDDWWVDPSIKTIEIPVHFLCEGKNILSLEGYFADETALEIIYLIGNFGVATDGKSSEIGRLPEKLVLGSITRQGLPFYSGNVVYKSNFYFEQDQGLRYWLSTDGIKATAAEISINGSDMQMCGLPDYVVEVTDFLKTGQNSITINLLGSRRNSFGPHHMANERPIYICSASFRRHEYYTWQDDYKMIEYGLYDYPIIYTDNNIKAQ